MPGCGARTGRTAVTDRGPYRVPPTSVLNAFESAARHGNLSRAARELGTSQSAISRQVARLETQLSARLFERSRTGVSLTAAGHLYRKAVVVGLGAISAGAAEVAALSDEEPAEVAIACTGEVSHLLVLPRLEALRKALGEDNRVRILVRSPGSVLPQPEADVILTWDEGIAAPEDRAVIATGAVGAFCSPGYAAVHAEVLNGPVAEWGGLTFLRPSGPGEDHASWETWFEAAGRPASEPRYEAHDSYTRALEAAVAGRGMVLGWRHLIGRHVDGGLLVAMPRGFVETGKRFYAALTATGRVRPPARGCLAIFAGGA